MKQLWEKLSPALSKVHYLLGSRGALDRLVGLDIDSHRIALAVARRKKDGVFLEAYRIENLPARDAETPERLSFLRQRALEAIVREYHLEGEKAVSTLPFSNYATRMVILPKMPGKELRRAVLFEARKFSKIPLEEAVVEYATVDEFLQEGVRYCSHLVLIAKKLDVARTVEILSGLGLKVLGLSIIPLALRNIVAELAGHPQGDVVAVLDVGRAEISLSIFRGGKLVFTREIPGSTSALADSISSVVISGRKTVKLDVKQAEKIISRYGILEDSWGQGETEGGIPLDKIAVMMRPVLEKMLIEIQRSIDFSQEQFGLSPPAVLYLSGEGALIPNFKEFFQARLHLEVTYLDPLRDLCPDASLDVDDLMREKSKLVGAIGCAMNLKGGAGHFLPREFASKESLPLKLSLRLAAALAVILVSGMGAASGIKAKRAEAILKEKIATIGNLDRFEKLHRADVESVRLRTFKREVLFRLLGPAIPWGIILRDLSNRLGENIQLLELKFEPSQSNKDTGVEERRIYFRGIVSLEGDRIEFTIAKVITGLSNSPFFEEVQLEAVRVLKAGVARVDLNCKLII